MHRVGFQLLEYAYDAMSSDRCYRKGLPRDVIEEELKKGAGTQLDPQIVPHMLAIIADEAAGLEKGR